MKSVQQTNLRGRTTKIKQTYIAFELLCRILYVLSKSALINLLKPYTGWPFNVVFSKPPACFLISVVSLHKHTVQKIKKYIVNFAEQSHYLQERTQSEVFNKQSLILNSISKNFTLTLCSCT